MIQITVLCGAPGSGKTTKSKEISKQKNVKRISFDELNCIYYSDLISHIFRSLENNESIVVDAIFADAISRKQILDVAKKYNCKTELIYMDTPLEECIRRNAQRPNSLPNFVVSSIYKIMEYPTLSEGWDRIQYI